MVAIAKATQLEEDERTTATGLARYAYEYIEAAMLVDRHHGARPGFELVSPVPAYFLASHAIELTLKAYLRRQGLSVRDITRLGHDLHKSYRKTKELYLLDYFNEDERDKRALAMLAELNQKHELRYIRTGPKLFPSWAIVEPLAVRLHQAVAPLVGFHSFSMAFGTYK